MITPVFVYDHTRVSVAAVGNPQFVDRVHNPGCQSGGGEAALQGPGCASELAHVQRGAGMHGGLLCCKARHHWLKGAVQGVPAREHMWHGAGAHWGC